MEWEVRAQDNVVRAWFDGVDNPELAVSTSTHGGNPVDFVLPQIDTVKIGWQLYQAGTTPAEFNLWIDDIALSSRRLGC